MLIPDIQHIGFSYAEKNLAAIAKMLADEVHLGDWNISMKGVTRALSDLWQPNNEVSIVITVTGGTGYLVAWFDWDGEDGFGPGEMINFNAGQSLSSHNTSIFAS